MKEGLGMWSGGKGGRGEGLLGMWSGEGGGKEGLGMWS